ncbi:uncharacterized protein LOC130950523 isoform X1 [Arachis stenosperma]|uniref:uncharacterized protein LOC130950523 isoform X1 n=1 Tax=Arachis stenosperma TaxID=217475 RepID=UPI0025AB7ADF|nr:uncharacterized protein LOC130950523 isoform X1 [Arachis stenosperma]
MATVMSSVLLKLVFPPPASAVVSAVTVGSFLVLAYSGVSEMIGKQLNYSKFWNAATEKQKNKNIKVSSRVGMVLLYGPAFLAGAASFWLYPNEGLRSTLLNSAVTLHYFKRLFEVLFVHKYSGYMYLDSAIPITLSYFVSAATMTYSQHLTVTEGLPQPQIDLMYPGVAVFLIGIIGNFYHHYLLSKLRGEGEKEYKIPKGGLFGLVICPHYLFEITVFYGISMISQTVYSLCFAIGTTFYLVGRSYATRKWYLSKFEDFPKNVKAVIPFIF